MTIRSLVNAIRSGQSHEDALVATPSVADGIVKLLSVKYPKTRAPQLGPPADNVPTLDQPIKTVGSYVPMSTEPTHTPVAPIRNDPASGLNIIYMEDGS